MAKVTLKSRIWNQTKKIGRTVYWLSLPVVLGWLLFVVYQGEGRNLSYAAQIVMNQAVLQQTIVATCTPRPF